MICTSPQVVHAIRYWSSGASQRERRLLEIALVSYRWENPSTPVFLATADLQGREGGTKNRLLGEVLAEELAQLEAWGTIPPLDLCLLCGDFYDYPDCHKRGGSGDITPALNALATRATATLAVLGNHDTVETAALDPRVTLLDGIQRHTHGLVIGGVGGIIGDPARPQRKSETAFLDAVLQATTPHADLLLLHQGPVGETQAQRGWPELNPWLREQKPALVLFGHTHWPTPFVHEDEVLYTNVHERAFLFLPEWGAPHG